MRFATLCLLLDPTLSNRLFISSLSFRHLLRILQVALDQVHPLIFLGERKQQAAGGFLIMELRILNDIILEISRALESLFDQIEYHEARRAGIKRQKQEARSQPDHISDALQYLYPPQLTK